MQHDMILRLEELESNPSPRIAVALVLDSSGSMAGTPIKELNNGVKTFFNALKEHPIASQSAEIAVISFGDGGVKVMEDFRGVESQSIPTLSANGLTPMGEGVSKALELLEKRKNEYQSSGVDYYQPWLVLMTDGAPTDSASELSLAASKTTSLESQKKLSVFPIAVGDDVDLTYLRKFSSKKEPLKLKGLNFTEFFEWLAKSVTQVSQSTPGDEVPLDVSGIKSWASV